MGTDIEMEKFREGDLAYQKLKSLIKEMCSVAAEKGKYLDYEEAMGALDILLQAMLIGVAWADGIVLESEIKFIKNITEYADILNYVDSKLSTLDEAPNDKITWDALLHLDEVDKKVAVEFLTRYAMMASEAAQKFIYQFAQIDSITPKNYIEELSSYLGIIGFALAEIDGDVIGNGQLDTLSDDLRKELILLIRLMDHMLKEPWNETMNR